MLVAFRTIARSCVGVEKPFLLLSSSRRATRTTCSTQRQLQQQQQQRLLMMSSAAEAATTDSKPPPPPPPPPPAASTKKLRFIPTCDLYDQFLDDAKVPYNLNWQSYGGQTQFCGTAVTVKCFEDNSRIKELVEQQQQQAPKEQNASILVVDAGGAESRVAVLGDLLAAAAAGNNNHRWAGIVIHGRVRDVAALSKINIGILALGHTPRKSVRRGEGQVNLPVQIGNVQCNPGDIVYCDLDGMLILRPDQLSDEHYD